MGKLVRV